MRSSEDKLFPIKYSPGRKTRGAANSRPACYRQHRAGPKTVSEVDHLRVDGFGDSGRPTGILRAQVKTERWRPSRTPRSRTVSSTVRSYGSTQIRTAERTRSNQTVSRFPATRRRIVEDRVEHGVVGAHPSGDIDPVRQQTLRSSACNPW